MSFNRLEHLRNISSLNRKKNRIGETNKASNGMILTIIDYRRNNDIDVMFEDGYIVKHTRYDQFRSGRIRHKSKIKLFKEYDLYSPNKRRLSLTFY